MKLKTFSCQLLILCLLVLAGCKQKTYIASPDYVADESPRIINIINFIRQTDYRLDNSDSLLFDAVEKQIELGNKYQFPVTFLFQYDALINPAYQALMKTKLGTASELGAWWEITQPQVEAAGIQWRGEHSWVSHANIAFTTGYTIEEREKLVDVYMEKFKDIYGYYPKSVGSWFIDAHTLNYMYEKYGIIASCNCKDQVGTDGYTLWGGYWNQAYYPSKVNAYMPAQTSENQIPVPIFRMLGSDPIYQYEAGVGTNGQGVISLEPVYEASGKNRVWVHYFLESIVEQPSLAFNYAQAGQENSFTWDAMKDGLEMQFPIFDSLRREGKIKIETLSSSGKWFKEKFSVTPATAVCTLNDFREEGKKTVWFNSRFYRASLLWEKEGFCIRDIHMFNERMASDYHDKPGSGNQFLFFTLPVMDRFFWSTPDNKTGIRIYQVDENNTIKAMILSYPIVKETSNGVLHVETSDGHGHRFLITFDEHRISITTKYNKDKIKWVLGLQVPRERMVRLPFTSIAHNRLNARFNDFDYQIQIDKGYFSNKKEADFAFIIHPDKDNLVIDLSTR